MRCTLASQTRCEQGCVSIKFEHVLEMLIMVVICESSVSKSFKLMLFIVDL